MAEKNRSLPDPAVAEAIALGLAPDQIDYS
jgi:hypothetical protein